MWVRLGLLALVGSVALPASATVCETATTGNALHCRGAGGGRSTRVIDIPSYNFGIDQYGCTPGLTQTGPERVSALSCDEDSFVRLEISGTECDVDAYVVDATCSLLGSCRASNVEPYNGQAFSLTFFCVAGLDYFVVVEGTGPERGVLGGCPVGSDDVNGNGLIEPATEVGYRSNFSVVPYCTEQCGDGFDNDRDGLFDCNDPDCADEPPCAEDCFVPGDDDGNGLADCHDPACEPCDEDCENPGDEDFDQLADCLDPDCDDTPVCCDLDGDGDFADIAACSFGGDCDDDDPGVGPSQVEVPANELDEDCDGLDDCYRDADLDGFGSTEVVRGDDLDCTNLPGEADNRVDCDDEDGDAYPGALELLGDGLDQDCDGVDRCYLDADGDGVGGLITVDALGPSCAPTGRVAIGGDCDDAVAAVAPGVSEVCNSIDDDCDGLVDGADSSLVGAPTWYRDSDQDGAGDPLVSVQACSAPPGFVAVAGDCDDTGPGAASVYPGAPEQIGDGVDQDCDGVERCHVDADGDGFGVSALRLDDDLSCGNGDGLASVAGDCLDAGPHAAAVFPGAVEQCNGRDDDCDLLVDDDDPGVSGRYTWYLDADGDGSPGDVSQVLACEQPPGAGPTPLDCDELSPVAALVQPGADEQCNGYDDDCDGLVDGEDALASVFSVHADVDGDGYGDPAVAEDQNVCEVPPGFADNALDCDDSDELVSPVGVEIPHDGIDQDCDGADLRDADGDGFDGRGGPDCADQDPAVFPGAVELADGVDQDCDGLVDEGTARFDDDGDGVAELGGDCDDEEPGVRPGAVEDCDGVDQDCDGQVDEGTDCFDDDGDGVSERQGDCHDGDPAVRPGAVELPGSGVDSDCDGALVVADGDGDGWSEAAGDCDDGDRLVRPGAVEQLDGRDEDCDGRVDNGTEGSDDDGDGFTEIVGDCDDSDPLVSPATIERSANGRDDDCDGLVDEGGAFSDDDGDGYTEQGGDCDDQNRAVYPYAAEIGNGVDDDCDGVVDDGVDDRDSDGWTAAQGDCDDANGWAHPEAGEQCDAIDNDCDGVIDEGCSGREEREPEPPARSGGCSSAPGRAGGLALVSVLGWRRRGRSGASRFGGRPHGAAG